MCITLLTNLSGRHKAYRSPQEFYPHLHWLLSSAQGGEEPCICKYCSGRSQKEINKIFPLPPCKEGTKHPKSPNKHQQTRRLKGPRGVTSKRGLTINRNSITTGPLATLGHGSGSCKTIGYRRSHPFWWWLPPSLHTHSIKQPFSTFVCSSFLVDVGSIIFSSPCFMTYLIFHVSVCKPGSCKDMRDK